MKIGIIGAGHIGSTLVRKLAKRGHEVLVANSRSPESLSGLAEETGAKAATIKDAARGSEMVMITIPETASSAFPKIYSQARR